MTREEIYNAVSKFVTERLADAPAEHVADVLMAHSLGIGSALVGKAGAAAVLNRVAAHMAGDSASDDAARLLDTIFEPSRDNMH